LLRHDIDPDTMQALLTIDGGETTDLTQRLSEKVDYAATRYLKGGYTDEGESFFSMM
jgi:hypothetical protein